ncbi:hypothetical protein RHECNPAF_1260066 [Rhizobium etli CNPAF512]|nr:hypothetical protein RHECNPAF_1260066 [Rhizobium etli CNPAF512]
MAGSNDHRRRLGTLALQARTS